MKKTSFVTAIAGALLLTSLFPVTTHATPVSATININTSATTSYNPDFRGLNNEPERTAIRINDANVINAANYYGRIGFLRWPGGTPTNSYSWKLGSTDAEYNGQAMKEAGRYYPQLYARRYQLTKGGERISDYVDFLQQTGAKAVIMVNVLQYNPEQSRDLAKYLYDNHVPVLYFELGNEISYYTTGIGGQQAAFKSATDYLNRAKTFNDIIKSAYPGAKTVISMSNNQAAGFDNEVYSYPNKYWDAITTHRFKGDGATASAAMTNANGFLDSWNALINGNYGVNLPGTPLFLGEHGVALGGELYNSQYHGIYVSESILRLVTNSSIPYLAGYTFTNGVFTPGTSDKMLLEDAYQRGTTVDTSTLNFNPYYGAPAASLKVIDGAINQGTVAWGTSVTGGSTVSKTGGTMPALFAQAFRGDNGKNYVVITNKSADEHEVTVRMNGSNVTSALTKTYTTATDPLARNRGASLINVTVQSGSTNNPVLVPPYSVMRVEWTRTSSPDAPRPPVLMTTAAGNQSVTLKWQASLNAAGYKVKYGTAPGSYTTTVDVGNNLTRTITGLTNNSTYYFAVTAYNATGESAVSNETSATLSAPAAPETRRAFGETISNIGVEWKIVPGATGYKVKYGTTSGTYTNTIDVGNNIGKLVRGLTVGTTYYFVVTAYNGRGESGPSTEMTAAAPSFLPLAPHNAAITSETSNSISIKWEPTRTETYRKYFEDGTSSGWTAKQGTWSVVSDSGRNAGFYQSPLTGMGVTIFDSIVTPNYEVETMAEKVESDSSKTVFAYGLVARYADNSNYYKFVYNINEDKFKIVKLQNNTETVLTSITRTQLLENKNVPGMDLNNLLMYFRVEGNTLIGSVNQFGPILTATDSTFSSGKFGLYSLNEKVNFNWVRNYRDNADSYTVYRSTGPTANFSALQSGITGTTFTDNTPTSGVTYYYYIRAVNSNGTSYHHSNTLRKN